MGMEPGDEATSMVPGHNLIHPCIPFGFPVAVAATACSNQESCFLCESPVDVKFEPCGHATMCSTCAERAKKCPQCKVRKFKNASLM